MDLRSMVRGARPPHLLGYAMLTSLPLRRNVDTRLRSSDVIAERGGRAERQSHRAILLSTTVTVAVSKASSIVPGVCAAMREFRSVWRPPHPMC